MAYLDYNRFERVLEKHFGGADARAERLVGRDRSYDSGYMDIVRFFGEGGLDPQSVRIEQLAQEFRFADERIAEFSHEMEKRLREEGRLHDGPPATRLVKAEFRTARPVITVQPCRYGDQAGSCFALDYPHRLFSEVGGTLRDYYLRTYRDRSPAANPLAIGLGVCGLLEISDGNRRHLITVLRSGNLASLESSIGPTAAGSVDYAGGDRSLSDMIKRSLQGEIDEELGLSDDEYKIIPLAYGREIFRGERPQLFCLVTSSLTPGDIDHRLAGRGIEFDRYFRHDIAEDAILSENVSTMNLECRMNYYLAEEYWSQLPNRPGPPPDAPSAPRS